MVFIDWVRNLFGKLNRKTTPAGTIEKEFGVYPAASYKMDQNLNLWYSMYTDHPPWETCDVRSIGIPAAIGRELARYALMEFSVTVSGGVRAEYIDQQMKLASKDFCNHLEKGLCLGGIALKPYPENGRLLVDASTTNFTPTKFDGTGRAVGGVFRSRPTRQGDAWFVRMEYHDFQPRDDGSIVYVIENKAFSSDQSGGIGAAVPLESVDAWAGLKDRWEIENLEKPLFAYFKPPASNNVEPESELGISVYAGATAELIRQADEQWQLIEWEYKSGRRKIYADGVDAGQFEDDLFVVGPFSKDGDFFEVFSPEFRDDPLYNGFQRILQRIEFNTGLAYGTISDPQSVEKTATEILSAKHNQYVTESAIQKAFQAALDDLLYAMNAYCDLDKLAPAGEYQAEYNWGDGVLDDPETRRQDMALDASLVNQGLLNDWEFRMKWYGEDEATAKRMLPEQEETEPPMEVEE